MYVEQRPIFLGNYLDHTLEIRRNYRYFQGAGWTVAEQPQVRSTILVAKFIHICPGSSAKATLFMPHKSVASIEFFDTKFVWFMRSPKEGQKSNCTSSVNVPSTLLLAKFG